MIITKSNVLLGVTPTVIDPGAGQDPDDVTDQDHSRVYTSGTDTGSTFSLSFGAVSDITYVAISGHNGTVPGADLEVNISDSGGGAVATATVSRNHNMVITFASQSFTNLRVSFSTVSSSFPVSVSFIAAGQYLTVPNEGEQGGYTRGWLARTLKQRVSSNLNYAPTALTKRRSGLKASLSIPNASTVFSRGEWQDFIDFAESNLFFIRESDSLPESSYICMNPTLNTAKAHGQTRALDALSLKFDAYNGL
jgi:hypothetical protein